MKKPPPAKPREVKEAPVNYMAGQRGGAPNLLAQRIPWSKTKIAAFCKRWKITGFSLFGSVLRDDFRPESDVDVLVSFHPKAEWSLWNLVEMREELETMFGRKVDLVEKEALQNPYRRHSILTGREVFWRT